MEVEFLGRWLELLPDASGGYTIVAAFLVAALYYRIQVLLAEKRSHQVGKKKRTSIHGDESTVVSTLSSPSTRELEDLRSKYESHKLSTEKKILWLQSKLQAQSAESDKSNASIESEKNRADVLEKVCQEAKQMLEKERQKVLKFQSTQKATASDCQELVWDEADASIALIKVQKKIHEIESAISYNRFRLISRQKLMEVEQKQTSLNAIQEARGDADLFLKSERQKIESGHHALEKCIASIELKQEKLKAEQFKNMKIHDKLQKEIDSLKSIVRENETVITSQHQEIQRAEMSNQCELQNVEALKMDNAKALKELELKLEIQTDNANHQKSKVEELRVLHAEERKKAEMLKLEQSKTESILKLKDTKIAALELKATTLKETEAVQMKQIQNLKLTNADNQERATKSQTESSKFSRELKEKESALEQLKFSIENKMETISKQKEKIKSLEKVHVDEQEKAKQIHEQLPQLLDIIKTEETKGIKLEKSLIEKEHMLDNEQYKVQGLEKDLATLSDLIKSKEKKIESLEQVLHDRIMGKDEKKNWFWNQKSIA